MSEGYKIEYDIIIRLTKNGDGFAAALSNKEVLKNAPFKAIFEIGQNLPTHYFMKKIADLTK